MRPQLYDHAASRQVFSISMNTDLVAKAEAHGLDVARIAEAAITAAFEAAERAAFRAEMKHEAHITAELIDRYGHPFPDAVAAFMPDAPDHDAA